MLLVDGVKYELWTPKKEVEEFHPLIKEHYREIFGNNALIVDGSRLESGAKKGSVPDWFLIVLGGEPQWHIVEAELSSHELYDHIVNQIGRFINGINNTITRKKIIEAIYHHIIENGLNKLEVEEAIGSGEIYKFISDLISKTPVLTIIIERKTKELEEAIDLLRYTPIQIVEFQTFTREGAGLDAHAHLFEPLSVSGKEPTDSEILNKLRQEITKRRPALKPHKPTNRYCKIAIGHKDIHLEWLLHGEEELGIELHLERATDTENSRLLEQLEDKRTEFKKRIGESLVFQSLWGRRWSRVYTVKEIEETPAFMGWAVETMIKFFDVFKPLLDEIDAK